MDNQKVADSNTTAPGFEVLEHAEAIQKLVAKLEGLRPDESLEDILGRTLAARGWNLHAAEIVACTEDLVHPLSLAGAIVGAAEQVARQRVADDQPAWAFANYILECRKPAEVDLVGSGVADHAVNIASIASTAGKYGNPAMTAGHLISATMELVNVIAEHAPEGQGADRARRFCMVLAERLDAPAQAAE